MSESVDAEGGREGGEGKTHLQSTMQRFNSKKIYFRREFKKKRILTCVKCDQFKEKQRTRERINIDFVSV